jgi:hypothetical protein
MGRIALLGLTLGMVGMGLAQPTSHYQPTYLFDIPEERLDLFPRHWPYLEVLRLDYLREHQRLRQADPPGAQPHAWRFPYSSLPATQETARRMRKAWQRFEERYYWRTITELNNPAFHLLYCVAGVNRGEFNPALPEVRVDVEAGLLPSGYRAPLELPPVAAQGQFRLDSYWPLPQVPSSDYCDDLPLAILPIMYIPGFCLDVPQISLSWCTPGYPDPLWFNREEADARVERSIDRTYTRYYPDYQADVLQALLPRLPTDLSNPADLFAPTPWQSHLLEGGAVVAPVMPIANPLAAFAEVQEIMQIVEATRGELPQPEQEAALPYFYQGIIGLSRVPIFAPLAGQMRGLLGGADEGLVRSTLSAMLKVDRASTLVNQPLGVLDLHAPGIWRLEEVKRWFPVASPFVQEHFGYASFFQAFNRFDATTVPDLNAQWANPVEQTTALLQRAILFWQVPVRIEVELIPTPPFVNVVPKPDTPRPIPVAPYLLWFVGERGYWGWVSVPEGYALPRVKGEPGKAVPGLGIPGLDIEALYAPLLR